jgi:hypothetical protein
MESILRFECCLERSHEIVPITTLLLFQKEDLRGRARLLIKLPNVTSDATAQHLPLPDIAPGIRVDCRD